MDDAKTDRADKLKQSLPPGMCLTFLSPLQSAHVCTIRGIESWRKCVRWTEKNGAHVGSQAGRMDERFGLVFEYARFICATGYIAIIENWLTLLLQLSRLRRLERPTRRRRRLEYSGLSFTLSWRKGRNYQLHNFAICVYKTTRPRTLWSRSAPRFSARKGIFQARESDHMITLRRPTSPPIANIEIKMLGERSLVRRTGRKFFK